MSLGSVAEIGKSTGHDESRLGLRLVDGGGGGGPESASLRALLEEVRGAAPPLAPGRAEWIYHRVLERHRDRAERKRRWISRMARKMVHLMAAVAGSRAFRILTQ